MAIFSNKIVSAKFIDPPNNMVIELLYREDDSVIPYVLEVDFTNDEFNELLEEITLDEIEKTTKDLLKSEYEAFEKIINDEINKRWNLESEKLKKAYDDVDAYADLKHREVDQKYRELDEYAEEQKLKKFEEVQEEFKQLRKNLQEKFTSQKDLSLKDFKGKDLVSIIESNDNDNDFVFNMKIAILEDEIIAKSKDKSVKLSIRKAKTVWQLLKIYAEIKEAS